MYFLKVEVNHKNCGHILDSVKEKLNSLEETAAAFQVPHQPDACKRSCEPYSNH